MDPTRDVAPTQPPTATPAGWYHAEPGMLRWWDGGSWTPHTQHLMAAQTEEQAGAFSASFAWWGALFAGFIPALVLFVTNKPTKPGSNRFVRYSAGEAMNVMFTGMLAGLPLQVAYFWLMFTELPALEQTTATWSPNPAWFGVLIAVMVLNVAMLVVYVLGAVRANRGVWWEARWAIPFFRAHRATAPQA